MCILIILSARKCVTHSLLVLHVLTLDCWPVPYKRLSAGATGLCSEANIYAGVIACVCSRSVFNSMSNRDEHVPSACLYLYPSKFLCKLESLCCNILTLCSPPCYHQQKEKLSKRYISLQALSMFSCKCQDNMLLKAMTLSHSLSVQRGWEEGMKLNRDP